MLFNIFLAFQQKSLTNQEEIKTELGEVKKLLIKFLATQSSNNPAATTGITDIPGSTSIKKCSRLERT